MHKIITSKPKRLKILDTAFKTSSPLVSPSEMAESPAAQAPQPFEVLRLLSQAAQLVSVAIKTL